MHQVSRQAKRSQYQIPKWQKEVRKNGEALQTRLLWQKWTKEMAFTAIKRRNSWTSDLIWVKEMQKYAKHISWWMLSTFCGVYARKNICFYFGNVPKNRPRFWRKPTKKQACQELLNVWISTTFEFGCRRMWRIMLISENVIRPRWITSSEICIILHILYSA